jgi:hypothetical protein
LSCGVDCLPLSDVKTACIVGAGYSYVAGLPLARDLLISSVAATSDGAVKRFHAVRQDYLRWQDDNPARNPEEYLLDLYNNVLVRPSPPFSWAVELTAASLATPRGTDVRSTNPRYGVRILNPSHCTEHTAFWRTVLNLFGTTAAITTNYDLLIERSLRHRPMKRGFGAGCYYGSLPRPQILKGSALPFTVHGPRRWVELSGSTPVYKLHGSLNWAREEDQLELYQDLRPAFRKGGDAAIVPPVPEKKVPSWLQSVWDEAETELAGATFWIVCGYSLPNYDLAIRSMLRRAAGTNEKHIFLLDPRCEEIFESYKSMAPDAEIHSLPGLPAGTIELQTLVRNIKGKT